MTNIQKKVALFWFRRDLRLHDNAGLYHALKSGMQVLPVFIFDTSILSDLKDKTDARVNFIHTHLYQLRQQLQSLGSSLLVKIGKPQDVYKQLLAEYAVSAVYTNHDYEPYAIKRDNDIKNLLAENACAFYTFKDHVIFEKGEVMSDTGSPYKVYTPYKKKWLATLNDFYIKPYPTEKYYSSFLPSTPLPFPTLQEIGFEPTSIVLPPDSVPQGLIRKYHDQRNYPAIEGTSRLGIHFRFGTISIREKVTKAKVLNEVWLSELIWREFFSQLMYHFPYAVNESFNSKFNRVEWRNSEEDFNRWSTGTTGYPMVDAGMRELNATGHMHNRVRMVVASFLTKHLLLDWRLGEAYFAEKLLDFELASNNGNWQWCAGTGADAQPYFRIFNPTAQQERFDKEMQYIKKWIPEFGTPKYPKPMIEHKVATARAKEAFSVLSK